ncbi:tetratricopeptide repeat protein [Bacteroidota bacterium]
MTRKFFYFLIIILAACKNEKKSEDKNSITLSTENFITEKAEELNEVGIEKAKSGNYDLAEKLFLKALDLEPKNPTIITNLGLNQQVQNNYEKAVKYYEKALFVSDSTYYIASINLGKLYYKTNKHIEGVKILTFVINNSKDETIINVAHLNRSYNQVSLGNCKKALNDYNYVKKSNLNAEGILQQMNTLEKEIKNCVQQHI